MATQRGIQVQSPGQASLVSNLPIPKLRDDCLIVKVAAVALNPTDWKHIDLLAEKGTLIGCDYAGTVEEVGSAMADALKKGDRVAGFIHGGNVVDHETGAFAEYILAKGGLQAKIPDSLSFEEASTLGLGIATVGQGLYQSLGLPLPDESPKERKPLLIYGGSTATGTLAIQYAKLSGLDVIATCSPHNFDLVKSFGADFVFDYNSPTCASDIRKVTENNLQHVFDCISTEQASKICAEAFGSQGGKYSTLLRVEKVSRQDIKLLFTVAYTIFGEDWKFGKTDYPAKKQDYDFGVKFFVLASKLLAEGKIKPHPATVKQGGLDGILGGLQELRENKVSGAKLVYQIQ